MTLDPSITHWRAIRRFNTLEQDLIKIHKGFYNYEISIYKGTHEYISIVCPVHGKFEQSPSHHLAGSGCSKCGDVKTSTRCRHSTEQFIEKCVKKWGNVYDYSVTNYTKGEEEVDIICKTHGIFSIVANNHLQGCPCPYCSKKVIKDTEYFIKEAADVHKGRYTYNNTIYVKDSEKLLITCNMHGDFKQSPNNHLSGHGCPDCGGSKKKTTAQFIEDAIKVHGDKYSYSDTVYTRDANKLTITCPEHGPFKQVANSHLNGVGCSGCAKSGFDTNSPAILYYLSINNGEAYKIGITNRTIHKRFRSDMKHITVLHQIHYSNGRQAKQEEQRILKRFKAYKYNGPDLLKSGNTELFKADIFNLKE